MSQREQIKEILSDGQKHCAIEFVENVCLIDYRRRICDIREELKSDNKTVESEPCKGRCGRNHKSPVNWYWIKGEPEQKQLI
jgi:hypothetical protein